MHRQIGKQRMPHFRPARTRKEQCRDAPPSLPSQGRSGLDSGPSFPQIIISKKTPPITRSPKTGYVLPDVKDEPQPQGPLYVRKDELPSDTSFRKAAGTQRNRWGRWLRRRTVVWAPFRIYRGKHLKSGFQPSSLRALALVTVPSSSATL